MEVPRGTTLLLRVDATLLLVGSWWCCQAGACDARGELACWTGLDLDCLAVPCSAVVGEWRRGSARAVVLFWTTGETSARRWDY